MTYDDALDAPYQRTCDREERLARLVDLEIDDHESEIRASLEPEADDDDVYEAALARVRRLVETEDV